MFNGCVFSRPSTDSKNLLLQWREQRAYRVGKKLTSAGIVLALFALVVDLQFSPPSVIYTDVFMLAGCFWSLIGTRNGPRPYFLWWPMFLGYWISILPSIFNTGGVHSPFLGLDLAMLFFGSVIVQTRVRPIYLLVGTALHLPAFYLLEYFVEVPKGVTPDMLTMVVTAITFAGLVVCVYEILKTERDLAAEFSKRYRELTETRAELHKEEAANLAKTTFLANVSHELRTPLAAILGYAELLQSSEANAEDRRHYSSTIQRNGQQLARLVDDLLDLSRIEAGKVEIRPVPVNLRGVLTEVLAFAKFQAEKKNLPVTISYANRVPETILSDATRLKQVLINVVGNAIKFTDAGSVQISVQSMSGDEGGAIEVIVRDTGRGMSPEEQMRLFKPFSQGDPSLARRYGGTGLGLNLSRRLAQLLGGDLELVHSQRGRGSVFVLSIPVGEVPAQKWNDTFVPAATAQDTPADVRGRLVGRTILIVEDSLDNQQLMQLYLEAAGAAVEVAPDGFEGIKKALNHEYDLVLMDIQMPLMDGYEAVTSLRSKGYHKPILALTANARKEDRERCLAVGCNDHLSKPITRQALIDAVARAIRPEDGEASMSAQDLGT